MQGYSRICEAESFLPLLHTRDPSLPYLPETPLTRQTHESALLDTCHVDEDFVIAGIFNLVFHSALTFFGARCLGHSFRYSVRPSNGTIRIVQMHLL